MTSTNSKINFGYVALGLEPALRDWYAVREARTVDPGRSAGARCPRQRLRLQMAVGPRSYSPGHPVLGRQGGEAAAFMVRLRLVPTKSPPVPRVQVIPSRAVKNATAIRVAVRAVHRVIVLVHVPADLPAVQGSQRFVADPPGGGPVGAQRADDLVQVGAGDGAKPAGAANGGGRAEAAAEHVGQVLAQLVRVAPVG